MSNCNSVKYLSVLLVFCFLQLEGVAESNLYKNRKNNFYFTLRPVFYTPSEIKLLSPLPYGVSIDARTAASFDFRLIYRHNFSQLISLGFGFGFGNKTTKESIHITKLAIQSYYVGYDEYNDEGDYFNRPSSIEFGLKIPLFIELRLLVRNQHSLAFRLGVELNKSANQGSGSSISYFTDSTNNSSIYEDYVLTNPKSIIKFESEIGAFYEFAFKERGFLQLGAFFKFPLYNRYTFYKGEFVFFPDTPDETKGTITPSAIAFGFEANYIFSFPFRKERQGTRKALKRRRRKDMNFHKSLYE